MDSAQRWALGPNHPVVNRFLQSLTKINGTEWVAVLNKRGSQTGEAWRVESAAVDAGRTAALENARQFAKQAVGRNHWAGRRWQDQAVAVLAESGVDINALEVEFVAAAVAKQAACALVCLDLIPADCVERSVSPFRGTSANLPTAEQLQQELALMKSALAGDTTAMKRLAQISERFADTAGQILWLSKAAEAGCEDIFAQLGKKYLAVSKDEEAHKWLSRAANSGDVEAMLILSREADRWQDYDQADRWLLSAADAGSMDAMYQMAGRVHNDGPIRLGLSRDESFEQATIWYTRAAEAGSTLAMQTLAHWAESDGDAEGAARWRARAVTPPTDEPDTDFPQTDPRENLPTSRKRWWQWWTR